MDIIFNPPVNTENKYIDILVDQLKRQGYRVHALDGIFSSPKHFRAIKLVHLNWFENVDDSSFFLALRSFMRKVFVLAVIKASKKKLVWTMHNRVSHEKRLSFFSRIITDLLVKHSHRIIIHCEVSRTLLLNKHAGSGEKIFYLPHPDFIGVYGAPHERAPGNRPPLPLRLLFVGAVKPYKNLELLIPAVGTFKEKVNLLIAGNPVTPAYRDKIQEMAAAAENVDLRLEFIQDAELPELIHQSDLLILPYDLESSLNSGTVILAFSYRRSVICPEIGTIADLGPARQQVLHYTYRDPEEHLKKLTQTIQLALNMKEADPSVFSSMGNALYAHVAVHHDKQRTGQRLVECYQSLFD